ncbi:MAG: RpiB/LacA/LacB family sugar-phosphate isomerase [Candidatus Nanohaloarchaea archaeon]
MKERKIFMGSDHAGFELKNSLKSFLRGQGYEVVDQGPENYDKRDDYPEYIIKTAEKVTANEDALGIVLGHSGQGEALAANKVDGIRAALYYGKNPEIIELSREHNNANVLSLGAAFLEEDEAREQVEEWLQTDFTGEDRHQRRLTEVGLYENQKEPEVMPAILAQTQDEMEKEFEKVIPYSRMFHLDVEDGSFVENTSLDFGFELPEHQRYEAHLMVERPLEWAKNNIEILRRFNFHVESEDDPEEVIEFLKSEGKEVGLAINPETDLEKIMEHIHSVDLVHIMTVEPGSYGSEFHEEMISRIKKVKKAHPEVSVEVDGHVTPENATDLREAGADLFVSGSYIQESEEPGRAVRKLEEKVGADL